MSVSQDPVLSRPTAGIDWASENHAVSIVDADGIERQRFVVEHTAAGLRQLLHRLAKTDVGEVGIERPTGQSWTRCSRPG
jgi:transposase